MAGACTMQVLAAGGLHIIGTERHESRRIDNQLRGRSGRQGDPGSSASTCRSTTTLMRIFAGDRVRAIMDRLKMPEGEAIEAASSAARIENAQRKVEARNFDIRKQLLEYDDVSNDQRKVIYQQRNEMLEATDGREHRSQPAPRRHDRHRARTRAGRVGRRAVGPGRAGAALREELAAEDAGRPVVEKSDAITDEDIVDVRGEGRRCCLSGQGRAVGASSSRVSSAWCCCRAIDSHWREHLAALDYLRQGIHLRGYAQKNPKQEYKREAFELFSQMLDSVKHGSHPNPDDGARPVRRRGRTSAQALEQKAERRLPTWCTRTHRRRRRGARLRKTLAVLRLRRSRPQARAQGWPQRPLSLRQWQEVQALPRPAEPDRAGHTEG
jgi:preprotein translocase subunit SecA